MRDLLNLLDNPTAYIIEGRGLAARQQGEKFANANGDVITFQSLDFYPEKGQFPTGMEMQQAIQDTGLNIHWVNKPNASTLGFGIATFRVEGGQDYFLGRYFKTISANRTDNSFATNDIPGGFKMASGLGKKEATGYKPSDILTQFKSNTPQSIADQIVAHFGDGSAEAIAIQAFMQGQTKVPRGGMNLEAFRDYFCEMLQPMSLVMGLPVKGNAAEASAIFFGPGKDYSDCVISFNESVSGGLYDSLLVNSDGKQIKLSSKGKNGASASVVNLLRCIEELQVAPAGEKLLAKHKDAVEILKIIDKLGHTDAPLQLGVKFGIITSDEAGQIKMLKGHGPEEDVENMLSPRLWAWYQKRKAKDMSKIIPIEHALCCVAYRLADYVNENTKFGGAASEILNNSALVQMYTNIAENKDMFDIQLNAIYPSATVTGVLLDASKAYMSTQGKGNLTFKILKNGAKESDIKDEDGEASAPITKKASVAKTTAIVGGGTDIGADNGGKAAKRAELAAKKDGTATTGNLGRGTR
jgi:hypothetical protein